ncbi:MAG: YbgC/FadM family acyl-CoA thioesterase [Nitrospiraceae bacterium]|jgi:acyl-CoA thioester hydrolase|nr:MAG: YbgC/FadM family acyl-CoA thioesterase [Nitrospiraceae bacterium]
MGHILKIRIYYEDTDCGGVVYYANYLRYVERARTEFLESRGVSLRALMDEGVYFVVAEASLKYLSPGRYGDILKIETTVDRVGPASIVFRHAISRDLSGEKLVEATVKLGCVSENMKPLRLRQNVLDAVTKGGGMS